MLLPCFSCLSLSHSLLFFALSVNAAVVTLDGEVISVDSAHNVFVNGIEVLAGDSSPTGTLSSHVIKSATVTSPGNPTSGTANNVTDGTQGYTSGISDRVTLNHSPSVTGRPTMFTRSSTRTESRSSSDTIDLRGTTSRIGSGADKPESLLNTTGQTSTVDDYRDLATSFSNVFSATDDVEGSSLGHHEKRTSTSFSNQVASQSSVTGTRSSASLSRYGDHTSLVGSATAGAHSGSISQTSGGAALDASLPSSTAVYASSMTDQYSNSGHISVSSTALHLSTNIRSVAPDDTSERSISMNSLTSGGESSTITPIHTSSTARNDFSTDLMVSSGATAITASIGSMSDTTATSREIVSEASPPKSATATMASSSGVGDSQSVDSSNNGVGGGIVIAPGVVGNGDFGGLGGSGSGSNHPKEASEPKDPSEPENSKSHVNSIGKPSTLAESQSQLVSSTNSTPSSLATSFTSMTGSAQSLTSAMSWNSTSSATSSVASASTGCATCATCLQIPFNPTATPDPLDDDSNDNILDDGSNDDLPKRRFINRLEKRTPALKTNLVARKCTVAAYTKKPAYPAPRNVVINERRPAREMTAFFATATYWAVPTSSTCNDVPGWTYMSTPQIKNLTPPYILGGNVIPFVSIDHVYEVSLLDQFFIDQVAGGFTCSDINTLFGIVDSHTMGTLLNTVFGQLASYSNPDLVGIDGQLNRLKGSLWNKDLRGWHGVSSDNTNMTNYIQELGNLAVAMSFVNDAKVLSLFSNTNARIFQAFLGIDDVITLAASCNNSIYDAAGIPMSATWGSAYKAWITTYIASQNAQITHTASMYSAAIPTSEPAHRQFLENFNQRHGGADSLTFPVPQIWPNSALAMQKPGADCTPSQRTSASRTSAKRPVSSSTRSTITPSASLPSSSSSLAIPTTHETTTTAQDDRICDNEATGQVGPCDQVGGIMIGLKKDSSSPIQPAPSAEAAVPKAAEPKTCDDPSAAGPCSQLSSGVITSVNIVAGNSSTPTSTASSSPLPSVLPMQRGGPQGAVVAPPPDPTPQNSDGDGSGHDWRPCSPGNPLEVLCGL